MSACIHIYAIIIIIIGSYIDLACIPQTHNNISTTLLLPIKTGNFSYYIIEPCRGVYVASNIMSKGHPISVVSLLVSY